MKAVTWFLFKHIYVEEIAEKIYSDNHLDFFNEARMLDFDHFCVILRFFSLQLHCIVLDGFIKSSMTVVYLSIYM